MIWRDNFNRGSLGTTAPNGATWGGVGTWSIVSNELHSPSSSGYKFLVADWGAADIDVSITCRSNPIGDASGIVIRYTDANNWVRFCADTINSGGTRYLQVSNAGTVTNWRTTAGMGNPNGHTLRIVARGNYYRCFESTVGLVFDYTDTGSLFTTIENHGVMWITSTANVSVLDDLVVSDMRGGFRLGKLGFGQRSGGFS